MNDEQQQGDDTSDRDFQEFSLLIPVGALLNSANRAAGENGGGFSFAPDGLMLDWPEDVQKVLGLKPMQTVTANEDQRAFRVLFEPLGNSTGHSYWSLLFPKNILPLVFEYSASEQDAGNTIISHTFDCWLAWPWHVSHGEKAAAVQHALLAQSTFETACGWYAATRASVHEKRPALFDAVATYFEREK